jgi:hypothetical protein
LALLGTAANGAEVYRSTDANGVPSFSDRPDQSAERVYVATPRPGRPAAPPIQTRAQREAAAAQANAAQPQPAAPANSQPPPAPPTAEELAEQRTKNCGIARERAAKYDVAHKLYREGANGEREYLSDAEMIQAKVKAAQDVATWCD